MNDMPRQRPPHLQRNVDRFGNVRWYVRDRDRRYIRIKAEYGTPEFQAEYDAAISGNTPQARRKPGNGTLHWLWLRYRESAEWSEKAPATRRQRENVMVHVLERVGNVPFASMTRRDIIAGMDRRRETPAAARHFLETMRGMYSWAAYCEMVPMDPTQGVKTPRRKSDGHHTWTIEECGAYESRWPIGTRARLAFDILLYTGLRRGDASRLGRQHVKDGVARLVAEKTGAELTIPILPPLARSIAATPATGMAFIASESGAPMTKEGFGNWFRKCCIEASVPGRAHGLRKAGTIRAVEAGATIFEVMALFGWTDPKTAEVYFRKFNREKMARQASDKRGLNEK